eukprot:440305_1
MNQNCINFENIKRLCFSQFGTTNNRFDANKFWKLLTNFKNIELLDLMCIVTTNFEQKTLLKLRQFYPNITSLKMVGGILPTNNTLINIFGNNLQHLLHVSHPTNMINFSNVNFRKLEEVVLGTPSTEMINQMLKSAQNVKKFYLSPHMDNISSPLPKELKIIIPKIFKC